MRYGLVLSVGTPREFADAAVAAEEAGWDAVFTWEAIWGQDAWITLTAAAMATQTIRLGTMLTPLPRIKPWEVAGRAATLDHLSGGRVQLAVGLGAPHPGWLAFETDEGRKVRAEKLDEGLAVYDGLMRGQPFEFHGKHYDCTPTDFPPPPPHVQRPRVPVWVVGAHPSVKSLGRAARFDGLLPTIVGRRLGDEFTAEDMSTVVGHTRRLREEAGLPWEGYDIVTEGVSTPDAAGVEKVAAYERAGSTWWVESDWSMGDDALQKHHARIAAGPPRA